MPRQQSGDGRDGSGSPAALQLASGMRQAGGDFMVGRQDWGQRTQSFVV